MAAKDQRSGPTVPQDIIIQGFEDGVQEAVQKMTGVFLFAWASAKTPADQQEAAQAFTTGLQAYKTGIAKAQELIDQIFPSAAGVV